nr:reverse transcriptase domain-containing protein [Bradyrhizobium pachyrhizi]
MHQRRSKTAKEDVIVVRYADDSVVGFQTKSEALRFLDALRERMATFGLSLNEEKTRILEFGQFAIERRGRRRQRRPETFDFLGFTYICAVTRMNPHFTIPRVTIASIMRATPRAVRHGLMKRHHAPIAEIGAWLRRVVQGT